MRNSQSPDLRLAVALLAGAAVAARLLPHAPNMALLGTLAFVSGRYWSKGAGWLTLGVAIGSDWLVGFYSWPVMLSVWLCYFLTANLGRLTATLGLRPLAWKPTLKTVGLATLGSIIFFLVTNTAVWAAGWYPPTLAGLAECLINGLPFARNSLVSDLSYTVITIAAMEGLLAMRSLQLTSPRFVRPNER